MKISNTSKWTLVAAILLVSTACSLPFTITPVEPEEKIIYVEVTSTPDVPAAEPQADATTGPTPQVAVNMDGVWTIWQGSIEQQLTINFLQQGYNLTGNVAIGGGHSILIKGIINQDSKGATGTWESTTGTSGPFSIYLSDSLQYFSGNLGGGVPLCGTRSGTMKPSPCLQ